MRLVGECSATASEVLDAIHKTSQVAEPEERSKTAEVALWLRETLEAYGPMTTEAVIAAAKKAGVYASKNTFDRGRKLALVESVRPSELRVTLGDDRYERLDDADRRVFWMRLADVGEPPAGKWSDP